MEIGLLPLADPLIVLTLPTYTKVAVTFSTFGYFLTKDADLLYYQHY